MRVDVMVIGAGAAGMAATLKAKEEGAEVLLVERDERTGGILNQCIHNGFGLHYFRQELTGPEYAERFQEKMEKIGIRALTNAYVKRVEDRRVILVTEQGIEEVEVGALVYTTGARERPFGSLMIPGDRPSGIFTAGVAQRLINIENKQAPRKTCPHTGLRRYRSHHGKKAHSRGYGSCRCCGASTVRGRSPQERDTVS